MSELPVSVEPTERIRTFYSNVAWWDVESPYRDKFAAEFDAWLLQHEAKIRAHERANCIAVAEVVHDTFAAAGSTVETDAVWQVCMALRALQEAS